MRKSELEQKLHESEYRISKLEEKIAALQEKNVKSEKELEKANTSVKVLSDTLYDHIANQVRQLVSYTDEYKTFNDDRFQTFSDEIYQHVANQVKMRDDRLEEYKAEQKDELWMRTFGFDNMMAELQLSQVEMLAPGNREKLLALKDTHVGEKCFVIGNGPSLKPEDLDKLKKKGIFCLASKGIYNIFEATDWRPDLWGVSDLDYIALKKDDINQLTGFPKLVCAQAYIQKGIQLKDVIYYPYIQAERTPRFFNSDIMRGIHFYGTITGKLINIAVYMGFKEIYLLGCDNSLPTKKDENGNSVLDDSKAMHFSKEYFKDKKEMQEAYQNVGNIEQAWDFITKSFIDIKYNCDMLNVQVYNATRGGKLEVFPRVTLEEVLR